jgi:penicillin-binding protein 2
MSLDASPFTLLPLKKTVGEGLRAVTLLSLTTGILIALLGGKLAYLQLIRHSYFQKLADTNRIRLIPTPPERGRILDRKGALLANSQLSHAVFLWPLAQSPTEWKKALPRLATYLQLSPQEIQDRLEDAGYQSLLPVRILHHANPEVVVKLKELASTLPGVIVQAETRRTYPHGSLAAHVLGYTGEITQEQLQTNDSYRLGDSIGQMGVESLFEPLLRGQWGGQQVEVDASGRVLRILGHRPPKLGHSIQLTLDLHLQQVAERALAGRKGAVVAMDPRDGAILAMASYPTFDPNLFSGRISQKDWQSLQNRGFPLLNRAMRAYPPASTFKIITTAAALESGAFSPQTILRTAPFIQVGGIRFWDWNRSGFGTLGFVQALAWSSDTFFYQIALGTQAKPIQEWSYRFGLGQPTKIGLPGEAAGLVPDENWKQKRLGEPWYAGDTVNLSIGQGFMSATPLQMAVATSVVANGGWRVQPILSYHLPDSLDPRPIQREWIGLSSSTLQVLRQGLQQVVRAGTGGRAALAHISVAGKTGTAEDPPRRSHAWFVGYAPFEHPEIVVVAFLENSGSGGGVGAAPIVREVIQAFFTNQD